MTFGVHEAQVDALRSKLEKREFPAPARRAISRKDARIAQGPAL